MPVCRRAPPGIDKLIRVGDEFEALRTEALLANPLLDFDKLLLIKRRGNLALPQNWQGNCVMRGGFDNEIAVLSPVRPGGELTTLYRPEIEPLRRRRRPALGRRADALLHARRRTTATRSSRSASTAPGLRQVTPSEPDVDNYDACYLPDERIIYDSTACFQGVPCVGGGDQVANLHVMNPDGTGIRQLVLRPGPRLVPDRDQRRPRDVHPLGVQRHAALLHPRRDADEPRRHRTRWRSTAATRYWPNSTFYARPIPGHPSKFVGVISGHHGVPRMGELIVFDPALGQHEADGVVQRIPGYGQKVEPIIRDQLVNDSWPRFLHPLSAEREVLPDRLPAQRGVAVGHLPGRRVRQHRADLRRTGRRHARTGAAAQDASGRRIIPDKVDTGRKDAVVYLADVYAGGGLEGVPRGTVKQLRLFAFDYGYQGLANHTYIGIEGPWDVHRILGTVEVEPDGSVRVPGSGQHADRRAAAGRRRQGPAADAELVRGHAGRDPLVRRLPRTNHRRAADATRRWPPEKRRRRSSRGSGRRGGSASTARCSRCSTSTASAATTTSRTTGRNCPTCGRTTCRRSAGPTRNCRSTSAGPARRATTTCSRRRVPRRHQPADPDAATRATTA